MPWSHAVSFPIMSSISLLRSTQLFSADAGTKRDTRKCNLAETHPELAAQWHPTKNRKQPTDFTAGSPLKVWWVCKEGCASCGRPHEWEARILKRTSVRMPTGCPVCSGLKCCECSSLAAQRPDLMRDWDWEANAELDPKQISLGSGRRVKWSCNRHGTWITTVQSRTDLGTGCPGCAVEKRGKRVPRGLLKDEYPELVKQLHTTKNGHMDLDKVTSGSRMKAVWVCTMCQDDPPGCPHPRDWEATIHSRTIIGSGCPYCAGMKVCPCKSLAELVPDVAAQWHPTKNGGKRSDQYGQYSNQKVWWQHYCAETGQLHEWAAAINNRVHAWHAAQLLSCPKCSLSVKRGLISRRTAKLQTAKP